MRLILKIAGLFGAILLSILVVAGLQSPLFIIESNRTILASPEAVYEQVGTITHWPKWSPWLEMEPDAQVQFEGPTTGAGAAQTWKGQKIGSGRLRFTEAQAPSRVAYEVTFEDWAATNSGEINITATDSGTLVRWTMQGENGFFTRVLWTMLRIQPQIQRDFARGLERLEKVVLESNPAPQK